MTKARKPAAPEQTDAGRVTLKQIAAEVGLPIMTVSRALRNLPGKVSAETRQKVLAVAERLRYRPNLLVRAMQTGRSHNIGVVVPPVGDFWSRLVCGIHDELAIAGWLPILHWQRSGWGAKGTKEEELQVIHHLLDRRVDGVILFPSDVWVSDLHFDEVWKRNIPLVTVDHFMPRTRADFVGTDDEAGSRLAAEHLLALGHRHVAQLAGNRRFTTYADRAQSFEKTIAAAGSRCITMEVADDDAAGAMGAARRLLEAKQRPTAVFCANDYFAQHVYAACAGLGLRIPEDVAIVGFADVDFARRLTPPLTTVRQDPYGIGQDAARAVLRRCNGEAGDPCRIRRMPELIVRASTAPPAR